MMLMRGHITDSSNFSRRALEICAFIVRMYRDEKAAKRWMEAGKSKKARERYVSAFPAWKLVKELLTPELVKMYEDDCLDVHPSFFAVTKRASLDHDRVHRFSYFDLDEDDGHQTFLVMNFFQHMYLPWQNNGVFNNSVLSQWAFRFGEVASCLYSIRSKVSDS